MQSAIQYQFFPEAILLIPVTFKFVSYKYNKQKFIKYIQTFSLSGFL